MSEFPKLQINKKGAGRNFDHNKTNLPIVSIAKDECTKTNVAMLASTLQSSARATALPVIDKPGQP